MQTIKLFWLGKINGNKYRHVFCLIVSFQRNFAGCFIVSSSPFLKGGRGGRTNIANETWVEIFYKILVGRTNKYLGCPLPFQFNPPIDSSKNSYLGSCTEHSVIVPMSWLIIMWSTFFISFFFSVAQHPQASILFLL